MEDLPTFRQSLLKRTPRLRGGVLVGTSTANFVLRFVPVVDANIYAVTRFNVVVDFGGKGSYVVFWVDRNDDDLGLYECEAARPYSKEESLLSILSTFPELKRVKNDCLRSIAERVIEGPEGLPTKPQLWMVFRFLECINRDLGYFCGAPIEELTEALYHARKYAHEGEKRDIDGFKKAMYYYRLFRSCLVGEPARNHQMPQECCEKVKETVRRMWSGDIRESDVIGEVALCCMCSRPLSLTRSSSLIDRIGPCCQSKVDAFVSHNIVEFMTVGSNWDVSHSRDTKEEEDVDEEEDSDRD
jgi:hypothetical protein